MKKILVTGATGQVGQSLQLLAPQFPEWQFTFAGREQLDLNDPTTAAALLAQLRPEFCINTAAYTAVDKAEEERSLAYAINGHGAGALAAACAAVNCGFLHLSSDYVYHNGLNRPLIESDPTTPVGVYAKSKLAGDLAVLDRHPQALVLRTSWVYSQFGHNFVKTMLRLGAERPTLRVVFDQMGTPTYAVDLAQALLQILQTTDLEPAPGIYHYSNEGVTSWYDFAHQIMHLRGLPCTVSPIESKDYPTPAERPNFSVLNKGKIKASFDLVIPHWAEALERSLAALAN